MHIQTFVSNLTYIFLLLICLTVLRLLRGGPVKIDEKSKNDFIFCNIILIVDFEYVTRVLIFRHGFWLIFEITV
jgi:hypothetical protein